MLCLVGRNSSGLFFTSGMAASAAGSMPSAVVGRAVLHNFVKQDHCLVRGLKQQPSRDQEPTDILSKQFKNKQLSPIYNLHDTENIISYKTFCIPVEDKKTLLQFKSFAPLNNSDKEAPPEKSGTNLDEVAYNLTYELNNVFIHQMNWRIYHPKIIFEDRIRGKTYEGLLNYAKFINLVKLMGHIRFVYVRFEILNLTKHKEDNTIRIRWRIAGLGLTRMILRYLPDKMWQRGSMNRMAPTWYDGYSVFYVDSDNLIYKHVADRRMPDQDKEKVGVVEKLKKLKPTTAPSPAI
jgi:hypothetical protein